MSTPPSPVAPSHHVPQSSVHPESPSRWSIIVGVGIAGAAFLYIIYQLITESSSKKSPKTAEKKDISLTVPIKEEKALCIFRIFREAVGARGTDPIPVQIKIADSTGKTLETKHTILQRVAGQIVSYLPKNQPISISITQENSSAKGSAFSDLDVLDNAGIYEIRLTQNKKFPLQEVASAMKLEIEEEQNLVLKQISFTESHQMTLAEGYEQDSLRLENHSDCLQAIQIELNHDRLDTSVSLSYSVDPKLVQYLPLDRITKDYQEAYTLIYGSLLTGVKPEEIKIISITYTSYREMRI